MLLKLQIARVTASTVSEIFRENQQGVKLPPFSAQIRVKHWLVKRADSSSFLTL